MIQIGQERVITLITLWRTFLQVSQSTINQLLSIDLLYICVQHCIRTNIHNSKIIRIISPTLYFTKVVNSGGTAMINCTWGGWPAPRLEWLHNGVPLGAGVAGGRIRVSSSGDQLIISSVHRADKGVYQCMARNERDSAQASAELRLGG